MKEPTMSKSIEYVWSVISFPDMARLGKRVPKKQFLESGLLTAAHKKMFQENVKNVYWEYTLKPSTCPVPTFKDDEREYLEVAVLQIKMNTLKGHKRIAEMIHRIIPYPLMLAFFTESGEVSLSIAPKRFSQAEHGAFVAEQFLTTDWIDSNALSKLEIAFVESLAWTNMPLKHYGTLYTAWIDRFTGYECSKLSGTFVVGKTEDRFECLKRCREIESKILELRGQLKKAAFNRQVELNTHIKKFEQELKQLAASL